MKPPSFPPPAWPRTPSATRALLGSLPTHPAVPLMLLGSFPAFPSLSQFLCLLGAALLTHFPVGPDPLTHKHFPSFPSLPRPQNPSTSPWEASPLGLLPFSIQTDSSLLQPRASSWCHQGAHQAPTPRTRAVDSRSWLCGVPRRFPHHTTMNPFPRPSPGAVWTLNTRV